MFDNSEDEYLKATRDAQVNVHRNRGAFRGVALVWNLFLLSSFLVIGYLGFNYLKSDRVLLSDNRDTLPVSPQTKTAVMGVSDTKSDSEYLEMLNSIESDIDTTSKKESDLSSAIDDVVNSSISKDNSLYTQAISQEIDSNAYHKNSRVVLVEKGDTLASISEKYYGNPMKFDKIIEANRDLKRDYQVLHIGQKLNVPY